MSACPVTLQTTNCNDAVLQTLLASNLATRIDPYKKGHRSQCVYHLLAHDQISHAFPLCICTVQVIKYWRWEWPVLYEAWWLENFNI